MYPAVIRALLPIHPPEIHTVIFVGVVQNIEVMRHKLGRQDIEPHPFLGIRVDAHGLSHSRILHLVGAHAARRVQVQRHLFVVLMQKSEELFIVRKQLFVPGIACPALPQIALLLKVGTGRLFILRHIHRMPIHIHHGDRERDVLLLKAQHQRLVFLLRIGIVPAPPVAQRISRQHRRDARQAVIVGDAAAIVVTIAEKVQIGRPRRAGHHPAVLPQQHGLAVIQQRIAQPGTQPILQRDPIVHPVQRFGGTFQRFRLVAVVPIGGRLIFERHRQCIGGERHIRAAAQPQRRRFHRQPCIIPYRLISTRSKVTVKHRLARPILKPAGIAVFDPQQAVGQHRDPHIVAGHRVFRCCQRSCFPNKSFLIQDLTLAQDI